MIPYMTPNMDNAAYLAKFHDYTMKWGVNKKGKRVPFYIFEGLTPDAGKEMLRTINLEDRKYIQNRIEMKRKYRSMINESL